MHRSGIFPVDSAKSRRLEELGHATFVVGGDMRGLKEGADPFDLAPSWWPDWRSHACVIVASGPSAKDAPLDLAKGRAKVIVINNCWQLAPWADVLYACDWRWWEKHHKQAAFRGLKICQDANCRRRPTWEVYRVASFRGFDRLRFGKFGEIGWGGNSGFHALNLAVTFGCRKIILVGYDMRLDRGVHWHGPHQGLNNPKERDVDRWRRRIDEAADVLDALGVRVLNCSDVSSLNNYRKVPLERALEELAPASRGVLP